MEIYRDGSVVKVSITYANDEGLAIIPSSLSYRVFDQDFVELVASTPIAYAAGDTFADITVGSTENTLGVGERRVMRIVELTIVTDDGTYTQEVRYIIEANATLTTGDNSFQGYNEALLTSMDIINISGWDAANDRDRKKALIEAYHNICNLRFFITYSQDRVFAGETIINLQDLSKAELLVLDVDFMNAIRKAQVIEADVLLGGDLIEEKRRNGLMSETIGESSNMFRPGKPLVMAVSKRALRILAKYVSHARELGRG